MGESGRYQLSWTFGESGSRVGRFSDGPQGAFVVALLRLILAAGVDYPEGVRSRSAVGIGRDPRERLATFRGSCVGNGNTK